MACLASPYDLKPSVAAGEVLFNAPALLGGQAAKAGLSCASCHRNGRDNPHFLLGGISGTPGTADVTSSFFGAARGNGTFDPVPIPDLAAPGKISRDADSMELEKFIRTLIVEEFSGREPSQRTLSSLAAYVRAIRRCEEDGAADAKQTLRGQAMNIKMALSAAHSAASWDGRDDARLLIAAARHQLGLIAERYPAARFARERAELLDHSRKLAEIANGPAGLDRLQTALDLWLISFDKTVLKRLQRNEVSSLYNPKLLAKQFNAQQK